MKIKFYTIGCKVNQYETQALKEQFFSLGYEVTNRAADMYIINSCSVTQRADAKSRQALTKAKKENSKAKVVVCGCAANGRKEYWGKLGADIIIPQDRKHNLVDIVVNQGLAQKDIWSLRLTKFSNHRAFVKIQDACDNFCSYCKIPYLRGSSRSRPKKDIIEEVARLVKDHNEIILCGVNIALYGKDLSKNEDLVSLVQSLISIKDLRRLRFSSLESCFLDKRFFSLFKNPKICSHVHLPFQSGDDRVLKEMDKKETTQDYKTMIEGIRRINPDVALSCDVIVGFPSEDDHLFNNTVKFLKGDDPMKNVAQKKDRELVHPVKHKFDNMGDIPEESTCMNAGYIFAPGRYVSEVPPDPWISFWGEEMTASMRAWTRGWRFYAPRVWLSAHRYKRGGKVHRIQDQKQLYAKLSEVSHDKQLDIWTEKEMGSIFGSPYKGAVAEYSKFVGLDLKEEYVKRQLYFNKHERGIR